MCYKELIEKEIDYLRKIPIDAVADFISSLNIELEKNDSNVILTGMGKAGQIAHTLSTTLASTGTPSYFLHAADAQHGDLGIIRPNDIIIFFSNSGKTREVIELMSLIKNLEYKNKIYGIVGESNNELSSICHKIIEFGPVEEICPLGLAPTTSTTCMSVISDLVVVGLMKQKQFTKLQYSKLHHGGYLNKKARE